MEQDRTRNLLDTLELILAGRSLAGDEKTLSAIQFLVCGSH